MPKYRIEHSIDIELIVTADSPEEASKIVNNLGDANITVKFDDPHPSAFIDGDTGVFTNFYNDADPEEIED